MSDEMSPFRKELLRVALKYVGAYEIGGNNKGPLVEMFQKAVDGKATGEAWCMGYVQFCLKQVEQSLLLPSLLAKSELCTAVWDKSPKMCRTDKPVPGSVVIWQKWANGKPTISGHTGIVLWPVDSNSFDSIEGNTSNSVGVVRDGDMVAVKTHFLSDNSQMRILGFLLPWI